MHKNQDYNNDIFIIITIIVVYFVHWISGYN